MGKSEEPSINYEAPVVVVPTYWQAYGNWLVGDDTALDLFVKKYSPDDGGEFAESLRAVIVEQVALITEEKKQKSNV